MSTQKITWRPATADDVGRLCRTWDAHEPLAYYYGVLIRVAYDSFYLNGAPHYTYGFCEVQDVEYVTTIADEPHYRILDKGDIIQAGDEVDGCADPWHDEPHWVPASRIGEPAPDPAYPAHSIYRRRIEVANG